MRINLSNLSPQTSSLISIAHDSLPYKHSTATAIGATTTNAAPATTSAAVSNVGAFSSNTTIASANTLPAPATTSTFSTTFYTSATSDLSSPIDDLPHTVTLEMVYAEIMQIKKYHKAQVDEMAAKISKSEMKIQTLEQKVDCLEQQLLSNSIEVYNVPIINKDMPHIDLVLGLFRNTLDIDVNETDIDQCFVKNIKKGNSLANGDLKSTNILHVKFVSHHLKEKILKTKRQKRVQLTTKIFGAKGKPENVYINDCLTKHRRQLLNSALSSKTTKGVIYVWTKNGNIFLRKSEGDNLVRINYISDLDKI